MLKSHLFLLLLALQYLAIWESEEWKSYTGLSKILRLIITSAPIHRWEQYFLTANSACQALRPLLQGDEIWLNGWSENQVIPVGIHVVPALSEKCLNCVDRTFIKKFRHKSLFSQKSAICNSPHAWNSIRFTYKYSKETMYASSPSPSTFQ